MMVFKDTRNCLYCFVKRFGQANSRGFTLIELLIVVSIMVIIVGVIGACLSGGIRVWDSARVFDDLESEAFVVMDIMEKDIRNSLSVYSIGFEGKQSSVSFPAYITSDKGRSIGAVTYKYDKSKHFLVRTELLEKHDDLVAEMMLDNVKALEFRYYQMSDSVWQNMGEVVTNFPDKVDIKLLLINEEREVLIERKVLLPLQGRGGDENGMP